MAKILLVEDDKSLREIYGVRLMAEGYEIVSAGDGEEALAMAIKERPDLIVSDVMMPKISGFDMLDILRSTSETKDVKVIMMTALSSDDQRARGESLGADRYLVKSQVGIEDVVRTVHDVLGDSIAAPAPAAPTFPASAPAPTPVAAPAPAPAAEPIAAPAPDFSMPAPEAAPAAPVFEAAPAPAAEPVYTPEPMQQPIAPAPAPAPEAAPAYAAPEPALEAPIAPAAPAMPEAAPTPVAPDSAYAPAPEPTPTPVTPEAPVAPVAAPAPAPEAFPAAPAVAPAPAPLEPTFNPAPAPAPVAPLTANPVLSELPANPVAMPQPTAPFSSPAPASLGERVIEPLTAPAENAMGDIAAQMEQALNAQPQPAPAPQGQPPVPPAA